MWLRLLAGLGAVGMGLTAQSYLYRRVHLGSPWWLSDPWWLFLLGSALLVFAFPTRQPAPSLESSASQPSQAKEGHQVSFWAMASLVVYGLALVASLTLWQAGAISLSQFASVIALGALALVALWGRGYRLLYWPTLKATVAEWASSFRLPALLFIALGLTLAGIAVAYWWRGTLPNDGAFLWVLGLALIIVGFWRSQAATARPETHSWQTFYPDLILLATVTGLALFMRGYQLAEVPFGSWYDESESGLEALEILKGKPFTPKPSFAPDVALVFFHLIALSFKLLGVNILAIRLVVALAGALAVVTLYFLVKSLFGRRTAFVAAFRLIPLVLLLLVVYWLVAERHLLGLHLLNLAALALVATVVLAPLGVYAVQHSKTFMLRMNQTSVFAGKTTTQAKVKALDYSLRRHLLMFNYQGDPNGRHNLSGAPMLDFISGGLLALGLGYSLYHWRRWPHFLLITWFSIALLPGILSLEWEAPQGARTLMVTPVICTLAAIPLAHLWDFASQISPGHWRIVPALAAVGLLAYVGQANFDRYFNQHMKDNRTWLEFSSRDTAIARLINKLGPDYRIYFQNANEPVVRLIANRQEDFHNLWVLEDLPVKEQPRKDIVYIFEPWRVATPLSEFLRYYPRAEVGEQRQPNGVVASYYVVVKKEDVTKIQGLQGKYYLASHREPVVERTDHLIAFD